MIRYTLLAALLVVVVASPALAEVVTKWQDDMQDAVTNRGYYSTTLVTDGDGYVEIEVANNLATFARTNVNVDVKAGDVMTLDYRVSRLPSDDSVFQDMFFMIEVNGAWIISKVGGGTINHTNASTLSHTFTADGRITSINFKPLWGYVAGGSSGRVEIHDMKLTGVPEPSSMGLLLLGGLALQRRRAGRNRR